MNSETIIKELKALSSEKYKENVMKLGIPEHSSLGVSTGDVRKLAKTIEKSNELAFECWSSGYHEAKMLACLIFDTNTMKLDDLPPLMKEVFSWDLCDHLCKNLILKLKNYQVMIDEWCQSDQTYIKRAAFTLIASTLIHSKELSDECIEHYLEIIKENSYDGREHVKKAVSWALREIGKRDFVCQVKAVLLAHELILSEKKPQVWIGKDALKEIENLVSVEGRGRLISVDSMMGKNK